MFLRHDDRSSLGNFGQCGNPNQFTVVDHLVVPFDLVVAVFIDCQLSGAENRRILGILFGADILAFAGDPVAGFQNDPVLFGVLGILHYQLGPVIGGRAFRHPCDGIEGIADDVRDVRHQVDLLTGLHTGVQQLLQHFYQLGRIIQDLEVVSFPRLVVAVGGDLTQDLGAALNGAHAQTDGHQDGFAVTVRVVQSNGIDTDLIAPVFDTAVNRKAIALVGITCGLSLIRTRIGYRELLEFRPARISRLGIRTIAQMQHAFIGKNRRTVGDQNGKGVVCALGIGVLRMFLVVFIIPGNLTGQMIVDVLQCDILTGTAVGLDTVDRIGQPQHVVGTQLPGASALLMVGILVEADQGHRTVGVGL